MDLSVIVCAHNEERHLFEQLEALVDQEFPGEWEVVVVDNGSTDSTAAIAASYAIRDRRFRVVSATERPGQSYAMKVGASAARANRIAFCDADDRVGAGWVAAMADGLTRHQVVTGPHEIDLLNPRWLAETRGRSIEAPVGTFFGIFPCIRGAGWGVTRETWERLGGLDEDFAATQDLEFSLRCWLSGVDIVGIPEAVVHYRYRSAPRDLWRQGFAYGSNRPRLARMLVAAGRPRPPRFAGWKAWTLLLLRLPQLVTAEGRAAWVWIAANRSGQVVGSIRERTLMI
jgi:glycosyltransferase involved in cell wall biosynthesis